MIIRYRGLVPDRFDAPFGLSTLIWAESCHYHCPDCFHQDRFDMPILEDTEKSIISKIKSNPFNNGIILGGFEWTESYPQMIALIEEAIAQDLEIILYTHYTIDDIYNMYSALLHYKHIYLKCGKYDIKLLDPTYTSYGVPLASTNQKIYKVGTDT